MNPWLGIPLEDYEGHMALPGVAQSTYLADALEHFVNSKRVESVAVIGCAGGNGFDRLAAANIRRLVGVDINSDYLAAAKRRYHSCFPDFELVCADICSEQCRYDPTNLAFAALIFEYVNVAASLSALRRLVHAGGYVLAILQLPHPDIASVTPTPFASLARLAPVLQMVAPSEFHNVALQAGFHIISSLPRVLSTGKAFREILLVNAAVPISAARPQ